MRIFRFSLMKINILFLLGILISPCSFAGNLALVIIDMQPYFTTYFTTHYPSSENIKNLESVILKQRDLIRLAKTSQIPIILVEYRGSGNTLSDLTDEIGNYSKKFIFIKPLNGMFDHWNTALEIISYLHNNNVTDLIMTGVHGSYCVQQSIEGALKNGYQVWADPQAIIEFDGLDSTYPYHFKNRLSPIWAHNKIMGGYHEQEINDFNDILKSQSQNKCNEILKK